MQGDRPPTTTIRKDLPLVRQLPIRCQLYGHSWELTERSAVKECKLCRIRGYCPGCTPIAPAGVQPFACTAHTTLREVQP